MKAIIKNAHNPKMSICVDMDINCTPYYVIYDLVCQHNEPEKLLGAVNVQLLKDEALDIESVNLRLESNNTVQTKKGESILEFILSNKHIFDGVEIPTFICDITYTPNTFFCPEEELYEDYGNLVSDFCSTLARCGYQFTFKPEEDEYGVTGGKVSVEFEVGRIFNVDLDCRGWGGEYMMTTYQYVSREIIDKAEAEHWKNIILYNKLKLISGISLYIKDNSDNSGFKFVLKKDDIEEKNADHITRIYEFVNELDKIVALL